MSKWECCVCGNDEPCILHMVNDKEGFRPVCCPVDNTSGIKPDWHPVNEPATDCSQLPDWCKVGEWVYSPCDGGCYCKITDIDGDRIFTRSGGDAICFHIKPGDNFSSLRLSQARLRPFNAEEMRGQVGKVIDDQYSSRLVTAYSKNDCIKIHTSLGWYTADYLMTSDYTIDGSPCGVLEHLENGEWKR